MGGIVVGTEHVGGGLGQLGRVACRGGRDDDDGGGGREEEEEEEGIEEEEEVVVDWRKM